MHNTYLYLSFLKEKGRSYVNYWPGHPYISHETEELSSFLRGTINVILFSTINESRGYKKGEVLIDSGWYDEQEKHPIHIELYANLFKRF